jgi:hypothetical protein
MTQAEWEPRKEQIRQKNLGQKNGSNAASFAPIRVTRGFAGRHF